MKIAFYKYHANANDFILLFSNSLQSKPFNAHIISNLCSRKTGIGADGLFVISPSKKYDFFLDYYNSDGSWETLCANGSRCATKLMHYLNKYKKEITFETGAFIHKANILPNGDVQMSMKIPTYKKQNILSKGFFGSFVDSGARHFVCESNNLNDEYILKMGAKIRYSKKFSPKGCNVNFYKLCNNGSVEIKTYEKGIEKVMTSCSSGSAAVVFHLAQIKTISSPINTCSSGGKLKYWFDNDWNEFWCEGPAKFLFYGKLDWNSFK